jgi:hypothetical protein
MKAIVFGSKPGVTKKLRFFTPFLSKQNTSPEEL